MCLVKQLYTPVHTFNYTHRYTHSTIHTGTHIQLYTPVHTCKLLYTTIHTRTHIQTTFFILHLKTFGNSTHNAEHWTPVQLDIPSHNTHTNTITNSHAYIPLNTHVHITCTRKFHQLVTQTCSPVLECRGYHYLYLYLFNLHKYLSQIAPVSSKLQIQTLHTYRKRLVTIYRNSLVMYTIWTGLKLITCILYFKSSNIIKIHRFTVWSMIIKPIFFFILKSAILK